MTLPEPVVGLTFMTFRREYFVMKHSWSPFAAWVGDCKSTGGRGVDI